MWIVAADESNIGMKWIHAFNRLKDPLTIFFVVLPSEPINRNSKYFLTGYTEFLHKNNM